MSSRPKAKLYTHYPWSSILIYDGATAFHLSASGDNGRARVMKRTWEMFAAKLPY